jgi:alpha-glucoside transport system substrate-binding protein
MRNGARRNPWWRAAGATGVVAALLLSGCASQEQAESTSTTSATTSASAGGTDYQAAAVAEAKKITDGQGLSGSIEMIGVNSGVEGETLQKLYAAFTEGSGVSVKYTGSQDTNTLIASRVTAGNPPDVADISLGTSMQYAKDGKLLDLGAAFGDELKANYEQALLDDASYDGKIFGVYQGFNNFMLWYNPANYSGPKDPTSWQQIADWTKTQGDAGKTVWCAAQNAGAASGFPGAQFLENLFLKKYGPQKYKAWGEGTLAWTSPEVKDAWQQFGALIGNDKYVSGGVAGILADPIATGYNGLTAETPTCEAILWGSWVPGLIGDTAKPGETIDFYQVPAADPAYAKSELFQATASVGFTDKPATKAFLKWLQSTPAQTYLASLNRWPVANKNVPAETYTSASLQKIAKVYFGTSGTQLAVGPNLLQSAATSTAFYKGIVTYLQKPDQLDTVLATIQATVK